MADDRMKNDDLNRNMGGGAGQKNKDEFGQQSPGRHQQDDLATGQRGKGGQGQQNPNIEDDEFGSEQGGAGQRDRNQNQNR